MYRPPSVVAGKSALLCPQAASTKRQKRKTSHNMLLARTDTRSRHVVVTSKDVNEQMYGFRKPTSYAMQQHCFLFKLSKLPEGQHVVLLCMQAPANHDEKPAPSMVLFSDLMFFLSASKFYNSLHKLPNIRSTSPHTGLIGYA